MYYVRYPLSFRQVEDILHERGTLRRVRLCLTTPLFILCKPFEKYRYNEACKQSIECHGNSCISAGNRVNLKRPSGANPMGCDTSSETARLPIGDTEDIHQRRNDDCTNDAGENNQNCRQSWNAADCF